MKIIDENNVEFILNEGDFLTKINYEPIDKIYLSIRQGGIIENIIVDKTVDNYKIIATQIKKQQSDLKEPVRGIKYL